MEKNVFFQNFEWDGIFATHNFRKRQKDWKYFLQQF